LSAPGPRPARRIFDWVLGLTLIGMGIVGGFVPVLQGWVLILAGLAVLSSHSRWARAILDRLRGYGRKLRVKVSERRHRND
jgi:uncharacterized membrane protein YbaN (DUF454 family)